MQKVIVICGPTASGKTSLSIELAKKINGEIVSADSMQIYDEMQIGTAKPDEEEMQGIKHYLIGNVAPTKRYSVSEYKKDAIQAIEEIIQKRKMPIIVGGTGLYVNSLIYGIDYPEIETDLKYRAELEKTAEEKGLGYLYNKALEIDKEAMKNISPNDQKRILRVLEIYKETGKTKTQMEIESRKNKIPYDYKVFALNMPREILYDRINRRVDIMIEKGLIEEVKKLYKKYGEKLTTSMQGIGYKEVVEYLKGNCTKEEMIEKIKMETRRYAKRQLTWFRKIENIECLDALQPAQNNVNIIVLIVVIIYLLYLVAKLVNNPTNTFIVTNGKLSKEETTIGYIVRDEIVVKGENYKNGMEKIKNEGERVAKGDSIFRYYSSGEDGVKEKIASINEEIQQVMQSEKKVYPSDIKLLDSQIETELNSVYSLNSVQKIQEYKKSISSAISKKARISGDYSPSGSRLKELLQQKSEYEKQLNDGAEYIQATESGIVSYRVDGLEETLTPTNFATLNKAFLEKLTIKTGQTIASSEEIGKIINNFQCYIVFNLDSDEAKAAKVGDSINIRIQNYGETKVTITNIIDETDGSKTIAVEITNNVENLIAYRKISFDVIWWSAEGFRIPTNAIKEENGLSYVVRNRNGYYNKMLIKILKENDDYCIVRQYKTEELKELGFSNEEIYNMKNITLYDELVINPTETQMLQ